MRRSEVERKLAETEVSYRSLVRRVQQMEKELFAAELRRDEADKRADKLLAVIDDLHKQLGRQPEIVVESILNGITPLFLGYHDAPSNPSAEEVARDVFNMAQAVDENIARHFPDFEFDPFLESEDQWPETETMSQTGSSASRTSNGLVSKRPPTENPFTSGSGLTSPPGNVVE